VELNFQVK